MKTAAARPLPGDGDVGEAPDALTLSLLPPGRGEVGRGVDRPRPTFPRRALSASGGTARVAACLGGIDGIMRIIVARRRPADG